MNKIKIRLLAAIFVLAGVLSFNNCSSNFAFQTMDPNSQNGLTSQSLTASPSNANVMSIQTGGCGDVVNEPCASVTICSPGTSSCQTIDHILIDTGSYGLRLFGSLVNVNLPALTDSSQRTYAECMEYLDGSIQWGPVKTADVVLGGLKAAHIPIHIIDSTFSTVPSDCTGGSTSNLDINPDSTGFNGILGIGLFAEDCGPSCVTSPTNGIYYSCSSTSCSGTTIPIASQVTNPVAMLPSDNNGVIIQLPSVTSDGAMQVTGTMTLGIGTRDNNSASSMKLYQADNYGDVLTAFNGKTTFAFIDSGSNAYFFPGSSVLTACTSSQLSDFFCPSALTNYTATISGQSGSASILVNFQIMSANTIFSSSNPNWVFNNLAGQYADEFDWGLPFFLGRKIAFGIQAKSSPLGLGPYYAF